MIFDVLIHFGITLNNFFVGLLDFGNFEIPTSVWTAVNFLAPYIHALDQILPIDTLLSALVFVWGVRLALMTIRSLIWSYMMIRVGHIVKGFF